MSTPHGEHELNRALELAKDLVQGKSLAREDLDLATRILAAIARIETIDAIEAMKTHHPLAVIAEAAGKLAARARDSGGAQEVRPRAAGGVRRLNRSREDAAPAGDEPDSA